MGESFVRPTANVETQPAGDVNAAQNADIGITAENGSAAAAAAAVPNLPQPPATAPVENEVPWKARHVMNEPMVQHRLSRKEPVNCEIAAAITRRLRAPESGMIWAAT